MNYKLKAAMFRYIAVLTAFLLPFTTGLIISIIGMCFWDWQGKAAIVIFSCLAISIVAGIITFEFLDDSENLLDEYFKEKVKTTPKPNAWQEK